MKVYILNLSLDTLQRWCKGGRTVTGGKVCIASWFELSCEPENNLCSLSSIFSPCFLVVDYGPGTVIYFLNCSFS